jgi:predicted double-glycine peptidase
MYVLKHRPFKVIPTLSVTIGIIFNALLLALSIVGNVQAYEKPDAVYVTVLDPEIEQFVSEIFSEAQNSNTLPEVTATDLRLEEVLPLAQKPKFTQPKISDLKAPADNNKAGVFIAPFFSQFKDITSPKWKKVSCGIASLAMIIEFHNPGKLSSVDTLLQQGIEANAYLDDAGWTYKGLINLSENYELTGRASDYGKLSLKQAYTHFEKALSKGPVMASVHYGFDPTSSIPHLVVITGIKDGMVYYNDPADKIGNKAIAIEKFQKSWKKRYIEFSLVS